MGGTPSQREQRSQAIEHCAAHIAAVRRSGARETVREFEALRGHLRPIISRLISQYRLHDMREDAEQSAAIGLHRALGSFDPDKARFSTHVVWQMRGELQSLRHRVRLDHRRSAKSAGVMTVSLDALAARAADREQVSTFEIVDECALDRTESGASEQMARSLLEKLLNELGAPEPEREIVFDDLYGRKPKASKPGGLTPEQRRQIVRRTHRNCMRLLAV